METSAKSGVNVDEAFIALAQIIKVKMEKKMVGSAFLYNLRG